MLKSIETIIHEPFSSAFLGAVKAAVRPLQNPADIMECPPSYTV